MPKSSAPIRARSIAECRSEPPPPAPSKRQRSRIIWSDFSIRANVILRPDSSTTRSTTMRDIAARGKRAIVVGGTGFYIRALSGDIGARRRARRGLARPPRARGARSSAGGHACVARRSRSAARAGAASASTDIASRVRSRLRSR